MSAPSSITQSLVGMLLQRDATGQNKYGTSLDRTDLLCEDWAQHAIEESLDRAGYLLRVAQTAADLRAENIRLAEENLRLRSMLAPILELARTLDITPTHQAEATPVEPPVKMLSTEIDYLASPVAVAPLPAVSEPMPTEESPMPPEAGALPEEQPERTYEEMGFDGAIPTPEPEGIALEAETITWDQAAKILDVSRDTIRLYASKGHLKAQGPKCHVSASSVMAYQKTRLAPGQRKSTPQAPTPITVPIPEFDVNESGRFEAIEHGRGFFRAEKGFDLWRICEASGYKWRVTSSGQTGGIGLDGEASELRQGGEIVEHWALNGLGQWESTPHRPGLVGTGNGVTKGAAGYKVPVLG